jgi:hypothetical protein
MYVLEAAKCFMRKINRLVQGALLQSLVFLKRVIK